MISNKLQTICLFLYLSFLPFSFAISQNQIIDSLKTELHKEHPDTIRMEIMYELSKKYYYQNFDTALFYAQQAYDLALAHLPRNDVIKYRHKVARIQKDKGENENAKGEERREPHSRFPGAGLHAYLLYVLMTPLIIGHTVRFCDLGIAMLFTVNIFIRFQGVDM